MEPEDIDAMEEAAVTFVAKMTDDDWGEIIKFVGEDKITPLFEVFQPYTDDKQLFSSMPFMKTGPSPAKRDRALRYHLPYNIRYCLTRI
jgi:hypothetical protein